MTQPAVLALDPIATFTHDLPVASPLHAYPPVPADELNQGEQLALYTFGNLLAGIQSPRHMYMGAWRDPDPHAGLPGGEEKPPTSLLLMVMCGVAPYETPRSIIEMAQQFNTRDQARLRVDLARVDGGFRPSWLEVEITGEGLKRGFRSVWAGDEIAALDLDFELSPPATRADPLGFKLRGKLPRRYNKGEAVTDPTARIQVEGTVNPLPRWVNY